MQSTATNEIVDFLTSRQFVERSAIDELFVNSSLPQSCEQICNELVKRGRLTEFQKIQMVSGEGEKLVFGPYRLVQPLGAGGMGQVFKAWHTRLNRFVALKFIHPEWQVKGDAALSRFQREARAIAQLHHPNVVLLYDADEIDGMPFIAMEFVDGKSLADLVELYGPLKVGQACEYMRQTALGLQHAFECGLVHRDIKPSNIVVSSKKQGSATNLKKPSLVTVNDRNRMLDGGSGSTRVTDRIKILDMGLALLNSSLKGEPRDEPGLTGRGDMVGTPDFMSPEQARDAHNVDIRGDLYSLGCTFYFILSGRLPFPDGTSMEKMIHHQIDYAIPLGNVRSGLPPVVVGIVEKLMAKHPDDRYQTPQYLAEHLAEYIASPSKTALTPTLNGRELQFDDSSPAVDDGPNVESKLDSTAEAMMLYATVVSDNIEIAGESISAESNLERNSQVVRKSKYPPIWKSEAHTGVVCAVAVNRNGRFAVTGDVNGRLRVWDFSGGQPSEVATIRRKTEIQSIAFAPENSNYLVFSELRNGKAALVRWDWRSDILTQWGEFASLDGNGVGCLNFSSDGAMFAAGVGPLAMTWKVELGDAIHQKVYKGLDQPVQAVAISPDRQLLAAAGRQKSLRFWDLGRRTWSNTGVSTTTNAAAINSMSFSQSGEWLAMAGLHPEILLWDMKKGSTNDTRALEGHASNLLHVQFMENGHELVSLAMDGEVFFWDADSASTTRKISLELMMAYRVAMSADSTRLIAGFSNGAVAAYDLDPS